MTDEPDRPDDEAEATLESNGSVGALVIGTGVPPTSPNFGAPRYSSNDPADFPTQGNAITDTFDAQAAKRGAIVDADIAPAAGIVKSKLAALGIVDADVAAGAAIAEAKLALATDAAPNVGSRRTLGPGANQAAPGNDPRLGGGAAVQTAVPVLDVGQPGQIRAGRQLTQADFLALGLNPPVALWNLSDLTDASGNARTLTNKGGVPFGVGINGLASTAAVFAGSSAQALYVPDAGAADALRLTAGSWGCWARTGKRATVQALVAKWAAGAQTYMIYLDSTNVAISVVSPGAGSSSYATGLTDVCDDRWHFIVATYDGTINRVYVDGALEAAEGSVTGPLWNVAAALDIGCSGADASNAGSNFHYGRVDEAFVTADVLSDDQVRALYCAKVPHGLGSAPTAVKLAVRRRRRGATLAVGDFPAQPLRLHNFTAPSPLNDEGSNGVVLVANQGTGLITATKTPGADGAVLNGGASIYCSGAHAGVSSTDAGLPSALTAHSYGCWLKTTLATSSIAAIAWGTMGAGDARIYTTATGGLSCASSADIINSGVFVADGAWHFAVCVEDNAAGDGVKRKLYLDGRVVGVSTVLVAITLAGANKFRVGANQDGTGPWVGQLDGAFVCGYALTTDQIAALYAKASQALAPSVKNAGDHVESADATSLYALFDTLDAQHQIDLAVTG